MRYLVTIVHYETINFDIIETDIEPGTDAWLSLTEHYDEDRIDVSVMITPLTQENIEIIKKSKIAQLFRGE